MSLPVGRLIVLGLVTMLPACAIINDFKESRKAYETVTDAHLPYRHLANDFKVAWNVEQKGKDIVIEGVLKNLQNLQVREITVDVQLLDTDGRGLSYGGMLLPVNTLFKDDATTFSITLKDTVIEQGNDLNFVINYRINSGAWGGSGGNSSFKVDATTGIAPVKKVE
jgi:hypothetical protein